MNLFRRLFLLFGLCLALLAEAAPSVALYYGSKIALSEFRIFDIVVVEPEHGHDPLRFRQSGSELYAYVSVAEVQAHRPYFKAIPKNWLLARNGDWNSEVVDQTPAAWPDFFADQVVAPLWEKGYRGFFLDTLDSYRLARKFDEEAQQQGLVRVIETLNKRFPGIHLILNRGFEIVPRVRDKIDMVAAESLFQGWNAGTRRYQPVKPADREWLLGQLQTIHERDGVSILAIDYVAPHQRELARKTAEQIKALGFIPWVTDSKLDSMGIGQVESVPRRILLLHDGADSPTINFTNGHRYLQMPLNHLGYVVDYADVRQPLPDDIWRNRYAGVVTWFSGQLPDTQARLLYRWLQGRMEEGLPVSILGDPGFAVDPVVAGKFGWRLINAKPTSRLSVIQKKAMLGFETPLIPSREQLIPIQLQPGQGESLIDLRDQTGTEFSAGAITPWGGFLLDPFVIRDLPGSGLKRWAVDPFAFLQASLRLQAMPIPDVTTENGRRLYFSHIDGDGFPSLAEFPGSPPAPEVLLKEILEKYRVPTTVSVIESEISPQGLHPEMSARLEDIARKMFRLPHVEIASHTYSHPFLWNPQAKHGRFLDQSTNTEESYRLEIPGYQFDPQREIVGSLDYIRSRLAPAGKPAQILLWSGDTAPGADSLAIAENNGILNMNGGDTSITRNNPTLTAVGPLSIRKDGFLQVYAPVTNENIYTNLWSGPFYGYEKVIETFEMTEAPRRLKPVDIYYHTYSTSKRASLNALRKAYDWADKQPLHPVFASEYMRKVRDFEALALARDGERWLIRGDGELRTLRLPPALGWPALAEADGVAGFRDGREGSYLHLTGPRASFTLIKQPQAQPRLFDANARLSNWSRQNSNQSFTLTGHAPVRFSLADTTACELRVNQRPLAPMRQDRQGGMAVQYFQIKDVAAQIKLSCPSH